MKIFKNIIIVVCVIFSGLVWHGLVRADQSDTLTLLVAQSIDQPIEVHKFTSKGYTQKIQYPSSCSSGNLNMAYSIGSSISQTIVMLNQPASVEEIEPTTTVNILFEKVDIPFNNISGGYTLEEVQERALLFGDGVVVTEDPNNDNRIIVSLPALTVEESNKVLCENFEEFMPPRILVSGSQDEFIRVWVDMDLFRFSNTPFLQTHRVVDPRRKIENNASLMETQEPSQSPVPTDFTLALHDTSLFLEGIDATVTVIDQFGKSMPGIEVVASAESNSRRKEVEVTPSSAITDKNGQVIFIFNLPVLGGKITLTAAGVLSTTIAIGIVSISNDRH